MRLNENVSLLGERCRLVPYRVEHVSQYHEWMQDEEIGSLTASEPLTLDEEYAMQRSWHEDEDKLTFIVTVGQELVGDVNLFLSKDEDDGQTRAECEVMIASKRHRRTGIAREALSMMLYWASDRLHLSPSRFFCRIGSDNAPSHALFSSLGFVKVKEVAVFHEIEMRHLGDSFAFTSPILTEEAYKSS